MKNKKIKRFKKVVKFEDYSWQKKPVLGYLFCTFFGMFIGFYFISIFISNWILGGIGLFGILLTFIIVSMKKRKVYFEEVKEK